MIYSHIFMYFESFLNFVCPTYSTRLLICPCEEEKCYPISSPMMILKDWEVQGPIDLIALSNKCGENVLFYDAYGDLCAQQMEEKKAELPDFKNNFLDIVLMVKTLAFSGLVMICLLADF